jgi:predicted lysophospholipase L1 biosynthesis ABC-type transport system permease subunit
VAPGTEPAVLAAIRAPAAPGRTAIGRAETAATLRDDPVTVGILGALALGALAAAVFAVVGFLVGAATPVERVRELAVLEALGLSSRQLRAALVIEDAFLLIVGLGGGVLLGLVLAWAVLPYSILGPDGATPVPPAGVVVPWVAIVPLLVAGALLLLAAVAIAVRETGRRPVGALLREWEG